MESCFDNKQLYNNIVNIVKLRFIITNMNTKRKIVQRFVTKPVRDECYIEWTIEKFSLLKPKFKEPINSKPFLLNNDKNKIKFSLKLYPKGYEAEHKDYIALYLNVEFNTYGTKPFQGNVSLTINSNEAEIHKVNSEHLFERSKVWGFPKFIGQESKILKEALARDDTLTLSCLIEATFELETSILESKSNKRICLTSTPPYIDEFFNNNKFYDFSFSINDQVLKGHKGMLAAASSVFASIFENDWKENKNGEMVIKDFSFETMQEMLRFIYTGRVEDFNNVAHELVLVADKYDIKKLKDYCEEELCQQVNLDNVWALLALAETCSVPRLRQNLIQFVLSNKKEAVKRPEFSTISKKIPSLFVDIFLNQE